MIRTIMIIRISTRSILNHPLSRTTAARVVMGLGMMGLGIMGIEELHLLLTPLLLHPPGLEITLIKPLLKSSPDHPFHPRITHTPHTKISTNPKSNRNPIRQLPTSPTKNGE
jgi:hypothetical protein